MAVIPPRDLAAAASVSGTDVLIVDKGSTVEKALPSQIVDAAIPLASQAEAEAGTDNAKRVTPLRVAQAIAALSISESYLSGPDGATKVGFLATGTDAVARQVESKLDDVVHAKDFGLVGGGSVAQTTKIQNMLNAAAGKKLILEPLDYLTGALVIPNNTTIETNGARFIDDGSGGDNSSIVVASGTNIKIDKLHVHVPTGQVIHRPIVLNGTGIHCGTVEVSSDDQQANTNDTLDGAISCSGTGIFINKVKASGFDFPFIAVDASLLVINQFDMEDYVRGAFFRSSSYVFGYNGTAKNPSPNAAASPGHNGVLAEGCSHLTLSNFIIEDSGEHGVRIGGASSSDNINLDNFTVIRPGKCGIKFLPNFGFRILRSSVTNCKATDCGYGSALGTNEEAFRFERVTTFVGANLTAYLDERVQSCYSGVRLADVLDVSITGLKVAAPSFAGIEISCTIANDSGTPTACNNRDITFTTPMIRNSGGDGVNIDYSGGQISNVNIVGGDIRDSADRGIEFVNTSGGSVTGPCLIDATVTASGTEAIGGSGSTDYRIKYAVRNGDNPSLVLQELYGRLRYGTAGFKGTERFAFRFNAGSGETGIDMIGLGNVVSTHFRFYNNNTLLVGSITTSGSATTYATSSDYRLKVNYGPIEGALDRLTAIPVYNGEFKAQPGKKVDYFIAHELAEFVPEAVVGEKDAVDDEGNPIYQGVDQSKVVPLLVAAVQELADKVKQLEAKS